MLSLILLVFAFVLFVIAGFVRPEPEPWRARMVCFGLACLALAEIVTRGAPLLAR
jgi:cytochrome c oxidase assembly factor CtaG